VKFSATSQTTVNIFATLCCRGFRTSMSSSIQELSACRISSKSPSGCCIAVHRRLGSILCYTQLSDEVNRFEIFRRDGLEIENSWIIVGDCELTTRKVKSTVVAGLSVESLCSFSVIISKNNETSVLFLDALNCSLVSTCDLSSTVPPLAADIDQSRKELLIGFACGMLVSYALRQQDKQKTNLSESGSTEKEKKKNIQTIRRKQVKIQNILGLELAEQFTICQIAHSEMTGAVFVLSVEGSLCCLETSSLALLWVMKGSHFLYLPVFLWVDRFGSDFILLCSNTTNDKERDKVINQNQNLCHTDTKALTDILEYWKPPKNQEDVRKGLFQRVQLPTNGTITAVSVETIHPDIGTVIITVSDNKMQLFLKNGSNDSLTIESTIILSDAEQKTESVINAEYTKKEKSAPSKTFRGVSTLIESSFSLPDCPVVFLSARNDEVKCVALHIPSEMDLLNKRKSLFVLAAKSEITSLPEPSNKYNGHEGFILKSRLANYDHISEHFHGKFGFDSGTKIPFFESNRNNVLLTSLSCSSDYQSLNGINAPSIYGNSFTDDSENHKGVGIREENSRTFEESSLASSLTPYDISSPNPPESAPQISSQSHTKLTKKSPPRAQVNIVPGILGLSLVRTFGTDIDDTLNTDRSHE
jgi:hypothetical protein